LTESLINNASIPARHFPADCLCRVSDVAEKPNVSVRLNPNDRLQERVEAVEERLAD